MDRKNESLTFRVGRQVPVHVHWTFLVPILAPYLFQWASNPFRAFTHTAVVGLVFLVAVLFHELGHMWAAQSQGVSATRIDLNWLGGLIRFHTAGRRASWVWISFAGPLVNILLAIAFYAAFLAVSHFVYPQTLQPPFDTPPPRAMTLLELTCWLGAVVNIALAALNLLPAFPLDGGSIFWHLLRPRVGAARATRIVGAIGVVLSMLRLVVIAAAALAGYFVLLPPPFRPNWEAARGDRKRRRKSKLTDDAPEIEQIEWRKRRGLPTNRQ